MTDVTPDTGALIFNSFALVIVSWLALAPRRSVGRLLRRFNPNLSNNTIDGLKALAVLVAATILFELVSELRG